MSNTNQSRRHISLPAHLPGEVGSRPGYIRGPNGLLRFATDEERSLIGTVDRLKLMLAVVLTAMLLIAGAYVGTLLGVVLS